MSKNKSFTSIIAQDIMRKEELAKWKSKLSAAEAERDDNFRLLNEALYELNHAQRIISELEERILYLEETY